MRITTTLALATSIAAATLMPPAAWAQRPSRGDERPIVTHVDSAADLAAVCDPAWGSVARLEAIAYCQGFLTSFGQHHTLLHPQNGPARPLYCVPTPGPTIAQSGIAFAAWTRENPQHAGEPALDGLLRWAQASFPCAGGAPRARTSRNNR